MNKPIEGDIRTEEGTGVSGVSVSNGRKVVQTDAHGRFRLPRHVEDSFVFITVPCGYRAADEFYLDLKETNSFDFVLKHHPESDCTSFSFVHITDLHISIDRRAFARHLKEDLAQIQQEVGDRSRFIVASGDLTAGGRREEFDAYLAAVSTSRLPVYHAPGNHDDDAEIQGVNFMSFLGPLYYSFDYGPLHFVVYDGEGEFRHDNSIQNRWLHADLEMQPPTRPVIIINHFPWGIEFYNQWKSYPIIATLSGHWHSSRLYVDEQTTHYNTPSLGFGGIDGSPRGYRLFTYQQGALKTESRALVPSKIFRGITFRPHPHNVLGVVHRFANTKPEPGIDWPLFHGNALRTGSTTTGPQPPLSLAWRAGTGGAIHMASPVVADGSIFQPTKNEDTRSGNGLLALDAKEGTSRWCHSTDTSIKHAAAYNNGRLFAVTTTGQVLALSAQTGKLLWTYQLGHASQRWIYSSPLAASGRVYIGVSSHFVALSQESGEVIWHRDDFGENDFLGSYASPSAYCNYVVVAFYTQPTNIAVLEAATGKTVWAKSEGKPYHMYSTPVIEKNGTVHTISGSTVRAFDLENGKLKWEISLTPNRIHATPALAQDRLFVATGAGTLHALDARNGAEIWRWEASGNRAIFTPYVRQGRVTLASPVVAGGNLYMGSADGRLYALDTTAGTCIWQHNLDVPLCAAPAISGNGLWIGGSDGFIYAFCRTCPKAKAGTA